MLNARVVFQLKRQIPRLINKHEGPFFAKNVLMIYHRSNNRETLSWKLGSRSGSVEHLPLACNHHTTKKHNIWHGSAMCHVHGEEGRNFLLKPEKKI